MIVRRIKPEELKRYMEIFSICFEFAYDGEKTAEEMHREAVENPATREDLGWDKHYIALEDDDTTIFSGFAAVPYQVSFDGSICDMWGIGGVATLPAYRRRGGIRACFELALSDMYSSGVAFSYLYPFSTSYYRKFGYEVCAKRMKYKLLLQFLPSPELSGGCLLLEKGHDLSDDVKRVYRDWQSRYNMMIVADDRFEFAWLDKCDPVRQQEFTYLYRSGDGTPKGYMTLKKVDESDGRNIECSRFVFTDVEGFYGLAGILKSLGTDHRYASIIVPRIPDITALLPEWSQGAGKGETMYNGMVRVVNVERVLMMAAYRGSGEISLRIADRQIEQNNRLFRVRFENGRSVAVTSSDEGAADAEMPIHTFSALITGVHDQFSLPLVPDLKINTSAEKLSQIFYNKPIMVTEYF